MNDPGNEILKAEVAKIIGCAGLCARRTGRSPYISAGRVTVNGVTARLGDSADPESDMVALDGKQVDFSKREFLYIMLHKPVGYVSTMSDERGPAYGARFDGERG